MGHNRKNDTLDIVKQTDAVGLAEAAMAYKLLFGQEPKRREDILSLINRHPTVADLRQHIFGSQEFRVAAMDRAPNHKPLVGPRLQVEVDVPVDTLRAMMARIEKTFTELGQTDPHWAVLTNDKFRAENIEQNRQEFFETGQHEIRIFKAFADRSGIDLGSFKTCFELGCGVGRVTKWLAEVFPRVVAGDIASSLLDHAQTAMESFGLTNVDFLLVNEFAKLEKLPTFDVFFSVITLQHNPPPIIHYALSKILGRLSPGGVALFQVPTYRSRYEFAAAPYLAIPPTGTGIEGHMLPQDKLFDLFDRHNCRVLEMREDGACGATVDIVSHKIFLQKKN